MASKNGSGAQRYAFYALAVACLALVAYAGLRSATLITEARTAALFDAERAIAQATAGRVEQDRIPNGLIVSVEAVLGESELGLNYVTVRNADNVTLVSRGRFSDRFEWLGAESARQWRGWDYQLESAEANRPLLQAEQRVGYAQFGVSWFAVVTGGGMLLLIWLIALLAGVIGFFGALGAAAAAPATSDKKKVETKPRIREPSEETVSKQGERARAPLSRLARRRERKTDDEFAPIVDTRRSKTPQNMPEAAARSTPLQNESPERSARITPPVADAPQQPAPSASAHPSTPKPPPASVPVVDPFEPSSPKEAPPAAPAVSKTAPAAAEAELHAPSLDAQPTLGDDTLDLRFYPIWRDLDREVLAGACAALAWRMGETRLIDADALTRLAEKDGALRAFTQWIARRFSLLHSNWRTLEIDTVPIVLPIPSAMLGFADAETVWRDALRRTDRDPNDLVLWLGTRVRRHVHSALPVRRALLLSAHDQPLPADCDIACIGPEQIGDDIDAWYARIEELRCPVLLGPVDNPDRFSRLIQHKRVLWFSEADKDLYAPRAFARLLSRHPTDPI